jgi:hypothetical protein
VAWINNGQIYARAHTPSAGWLATATVSPSSESVIWPPVAVVRPDGSAVVMWAAQRSADQVIEAAVRSTAGTWSTPVVISRTGLPSAGPVQMGVDGTGNVLAAWAQIDSSATRSISSATLPASGGWSAPSVVATPVASVFRGVSVAVNASGRQ